MDLDTFNGTADGWTESDYYSLFSAMLMQAEITLIYKMVLRMFKS